MLRTPCICNGLATHGPAILLQTKDWRILPPKLSLFSYVYPGASGQARAYGTRLRVCAPALWKGGQNRGMPRGESAGRIPWPVRRPSLCLRLWNPIAVRSRPKLTHRNVHERTQTRAMTRGDRGAHSTGVAWQSPSSRLAFASQAPSCDQANALRVTKHILSYCIVTS